MKARKVKGLKPTEPLRANAALIVAPASTSCARLPRGRSSRAAEPPSTTCGSPPNGCVTCSRSTGGCFGPEADAARSVAKELQGVLGEIHDCDVMRPKIAGIDALEGLLRTRRELLYARFVELWRAGGDRGGLEPA